MFGVCVIVVGNFVNINVLIVLVFVDGVLVDWFMVLIWFDENCVCV